MSEDKQVLLERSLLKSIGNLIRPEDERDKFKSIHIDLFSGVLYTGLSKLEKRRRLPWIHRKKEVPSHIIPKFQPIFIIGYDLDDLNLVYEIWYSTLDSNYKIFDRFGKNVGGSSEELLVAVNNLIDIVWKVEDIDPSLRREFSQELRRSIGSAGSRIERSAEQAERNIEREQKQRQILKPEWKKLARDSNFIQWMMDNYDEDVKQWEYDDWMEYEEHFQEYMYAEGQEIINKNMFLKESWEESEKFVNDLLEQTITTRGLLAQALGNKIIEYKDTRMDKHKISILWGPILGRSIEFPNKYFHSFPILGNIAKKVRKVFGVDKEAVFVTGWTFDNKIDFEIWFVKSVSSDRDNQFVVFDLNSGRVIGKGFTKVRQAFDVIEKKLALPKTYFDDEEQEYRL